MTDRLFAEVTIGGEFSHETLGLLSDFLENENIHVVLLDEHYQETGEVCWPLNADQVEGCYLHFEDTEAANGEFPEVEIFLQGNGIGFDRWTEAKNENDAENLQYRMGMDCPEIRYETNSRGIGISETVMKKVVSVLEDPATDISREELLAELRREFPVMPEILSTVSFENS